MRSLIRGLAAALVVAGLCGFSSAQDSSQPSGADDSTQPLMPPLATNYANALKGWDALLSSPVSSSMGNSQENSFVRDVINALPDSATDGWTVCSVTFASLGGSKSPALIASMDVNGRHFCNYIFVITRTRNAVVCQGVYTWRVANVRDLLIDIKGDGKLELAVPTEASDYHGDRCMATWTRVLTVEGGTLVDRSAQFGGFYRARLSKIVNELPAAKAEDQSDGLDRAVCLQMESDRISRFLGNAPTAGEDTAFEWVKSANQSLRIKGIIVLAHIGDKRAKAALEKLAQDTDPLVATTAKFYLGQNVSVP